ncbi:hypothetical protein MTBGP_09580 [Moorella thermoacetica]|uniref:hypothetical protein n=1 Tax=Neomoorella thermoacetica TaxID=1525 RepID=UPI0030D5BE07
MSKVMTLTLNEEAAAVLQILTEPGGADVLAEFLLPKRDNVSRYIKKINIVYSDINDPQFCEIWDREACLFNSLMDSLTPEQQEMAKKWRETLEELYVYYEKKANVASIVAGMAFLSKWIMDKCNLSRTSSQEAHRTTIAGNYLALSSF